MTGSFWNLDERGCFVAPGLSALVFHNSYPEGKQGGLEIIQHDERVLTCGDVRVATMPGQWDRRPQTGDRQIVDDVKVSVPGRFPDLDLSYTVSVQPEGRALRVSVDLDAPLPPELEGQVGFNLELYPGAYVGKTFKLGGVSHIATTERRFPQQDNGPRYVRPGYANAASTPADGVDELCPAPMAGGSHLLAALEDPLRRFEVVSESGTMALYDGRQLTQNGWFVLRELIQIGATTDAVVWLITPNAVPDWRRKPVIAVSQVGYHPEQVKQAILELDPRTETLSDAVVERIGTDGPEAALTAQPVRAASFLCYAYAVFDFTEVETPGLYRVRYGDQVTDVFQISPTIYRYEVWQPTLETFFPVQMCHMAVHDRYRLWHGACHLDDALQAPTSHQHFDGYRQHADTDTAYAPLEHVPHQDRGGWHDAGDYDLATGSQARTTHTLALARELFGVDTDQTTVDWGRRAVHLHTPDGVPDIVEQVAHGVLHLLGGYRATAADGYAGHSFHGIISSTLGQYVHLGDAATMTDNCIYVGTPATGDRGPSSDDGQKPESPWEGGHASGSLPGLEDDRWVFTNHDTALEYQVAAALAASSRVLTPWMSDLAVECRTVAEQVWAYEQSHAPVSQPGGYVPRDVPAQEVLAAVELLLTTGGPKYRDRLLALWPEIDAAPLRLGAAVARALPEIDDEVFVGKLRERVGQALEDTKAAQAMNPFGVVFEPRIWGVGWQLLRQGVGLYQLWSAFPELVDREMLLRIVNYNLGCHPASTTSLVSGVGARSATVAYGVNRADWSYVPGGVISGPALIRPDFPELKEPWPYLWQQTEYVIGGAADYIFCVLAADRMLKTG